MSEPSLNALLRELVDDTTQLFRQELRLAQAEVKQSIRQAQANVVLVVAGLMLAFCALLILLEAIVMGLATAMPGWLASIIVAVVVLSAVTCSSTSLWLVSAWATVTAVRSAATVVVEARSTPFTSSTLFFLTRSSAR